MGKCFSHLRILVEIIGEIKPHRYKICHLTGKLYQLNLQRSSSLSLLQVSIGWRIWIAMREHLSFLSSCSQIPHGRVSLPQPFTHRGTQAQTIGPTDLHSHSLYESLLPQTCWLSRTVMFQHQPPSPAYQPWHSTQVNSTNPPKAKGGVKCPSFKASLSFFLLVQPLSICSNTLMTGRAG